ncbi:helix-turn-helix domain-containing protein [Streptomyces sp. R35]|uniref:Helix-turn-helix domain-containing protein n=1 Tax=Streptomyces sp. R35 TaxID=3238630 RepID=A0AB39SN66_9ACTN
MEDEIWLTVKEAALFVGVDVQTVYSWVRQGHLKVTGSTTSAGSSSAISTSPRPSWPRELRRSGCSHRPPGAPSARRPAQSAFVLSVVG